MEGELRLPVPLAEAISPVLEACPLATAMPRLVVREGCADRVVSAAEEACRHPMIASSPALQAGLWLLVDDLERSHAISQGIDTPTGSYWHAIMHRREGDFSNAKYWLRQAGSHPVWESLAMDPSAFVDEVARRQHVNPTDLVELQREEWVRLMRFGHDDVGGT